MTSSCPRVPNESQTPTWSLARGPANKPRSTLTRHHQRNRRWRRWCQQTTRIRLLPAWRMWAGVPQEPAKDLLAQARVRLGDHFWFILFESPALSTQQQLFQLLFLLLLEGDFLALALSLIGLPFILGYRVILFRFKVAFFGITLLKSWVWVSGMYISSRG